MRNRKGFQPIVVGGKNFIYNISFIYPVDILIVYGENDKKNRNPFKKH